MREMKPSPQMEVAVIFGSGGGIGMQVAKAFLRENHRVVGVDIRPLQGHSQELLGSEENYLHQMFDISDEARLEACTELANKDGRLQHVVDVSGGALSEEALLGDPLEVPAEMFSRSLEMNLVNPFKIARSALPHLRTNEGNRSLTFTSSINALSGIGIFAYSSAKAGVVALGRNLAVSEGEKGVRVNVVAPGTVITAFTEELYRDNPSHFDEFRLTTTLGRTSTPLETAEAYLSLATKLTSVTGVTLAVDAGQLARWR